MRPAWACPDLGKEREPGTYLIVDGTTEEFPECPAAWLRMPGDVEWLSERFGRPAFAPHLENGAPHPASIVGMYAAEIESGARSSDSLSPRVISLVHLYMRERQRARDYSFEQRRASR